MSFSLSCSRFSLSKVVSEFISRNTSAFSFFTFPRPPYFLVSIGFFVCPLTRLIFTRFVPKESPWNKTFAKWFCRHCWKWFSSRLEVFSMRWSFNIFPCHLNFFILLLFTAITSEIYAFFIYLTFYFHNYLFSEKFKFRFYRIP